MQTAFLNTAQRSHSTVATDIALSRPKQSASFFPAGSRYSDSRGWRARERTRRVREGLLRPPPQPSSRPPNLNSPAARAVRQVPPRNQPDGSPREYFAGAPCVDDVSMVDILHCMFVIRVESLYTNEMKNALLTMSVVLIVELYTQL